MSYRRPSTAGKRRWSRSEDYWTLALAQRRERHAQLAHELGEQHPDTVACRATVDEAEARVAAGRFGKKGPQ
jgi:predicted component of type VI protein secretion system